MKEKNIVISGGHTGGHIFPLIAIYSALKQNHSSKMYFYGSKNGPEQQIAIDHKINFKNISQTTN